MRRPILHIAEILAWADDFRRYVGRWPRRDDGKVTGGLGLTWCAIDVALNQGHRGLPRGLSLAKLFQRQRKARHRSHPPPLGIKQILEWADAHHARTGRWPTNRAGPIDGVPGETWQAVQQALSIGRRSLPGGSSLHKLLIQHRRLRKPRPLTPKQVLAWADTYHARTGTWPYATSGRIPSTRGETWKRVNWALTGGSRGLVGHGSLAQFLARHRGVRNRKALPKLRTESILKWIAEFHKRTGKWPTHTSGAILTAPGETWSGVHTALVRGYRGLPGGSSLYRLNQRVRGR